MSEIQIHDRQISTARDTFRVSFTVSSDFDQELWFELPIEYIDWVTESYDAAVVGLILPAMVTGKNLRIDGPLSPRLVWFLNRTVMPILTAVQKNAQPISIEGFSPSTEVHLHANTVAIGLSNGIDSLTAVHDYGPDGAAPDDLRITHLVFNEVGAAGRFRSITAAKLSQLRYQNVMASAQRLSLPLIKVSSNVDDHQGELTHINTHTLKNLTTPLLLQKGIGTYLYAADLQWSDMMVEAENLSFTDPMLVPGLSTERTTMRSVGPEHTREEKTILMAEYDHARTFLDVCMRSRPMCSSCLKCMNVLATADANGVLERFSKVFNLQTYRQFKIRYLAFLKFYRPDSFLDGSRQCRPEGLKEHIVYQWLVLLHRADRILKKLPGYAQYADKGIIGRVRTSCLYRVSEL